MFARYGLARMFSDRLNNRVSVPANHLYGCILNFGWRSLGTPRNESNNWLRQLPRDVYFFLNPVFVVDVHSGDDQDAVNVEDLATEKQKEGVVSDVSIWVDERVMFWYGVIHVSEVRRCLIEKIYQSFVAFTVGPCVAYEESVRA